MEQPKRPSIRDIARIAGVSPTTVSHALNRVPDTRVAPETRARIERVAEEMSYTPNGLARALRLKRSNTLAILSSEIATTPYAGRLIVGAQEAASKQGWVVMVMTTGGDRSVEEREVDAIWRHRVDGVLYADTAHRVVHVPSSLKGKPVVLANAEAAEGSFWSAFPDEFQGGYAATMELLDSGHREIGFVNTSEDLPARLGRLRGYRNALSECGVAFQPDLVHEAGGSQAQHGYDGATRLLSAARRPTALVCFNDRVAMGAYRAAAGLGLSIPRDVSIIGFDNQEIVAEALAPQLSTVALPHYEMGAAAVEAVLAAITSRTEPQPVQLALPNSVIRRGSVAPA
jgi:LacI family transcriptional regulator